MFFRTLFFGCVAAVVLVCCTDTAHQQDQNVSVTDSIAILLQKSLSLPDTMTSQSLIYLERALQLAQEKNIEKSFLFEIYKLLGIQSKTADILFQIYYHLGVQSELTGNYDLAISYFREAINRSDGKRFVDLANAYNYIGQIALRQGQYNIAMEYFPKALDLYLRMPDLAGQALSFRNIGAAYQMGGYFEQAKDLYEQSMDLYVSLNNELGVADCLNNLGGLQIEQNQPLPALEHYLESEKIYERTGSNEQLWNICFNIGSTYQWINEMDQARTYYDKMLTLSQSLQSLSVLADTYRILGNFLNETKQQDSALYYYGKSIEISNTNRLYGVLYSALEERSRLYAAMGRCNEAYIDMIAYAFAYDEVHNRRNIRAFTERSMQYEFDMQQKEQLYQNRIQRIVIIWLFVAAFLISAVGVQSYRSFVQKKNANVLLADKNTQLKRQKEEITDSIRYASLIQKATLPAKEYSDSVLHEHFIYYKPRDIVSGDFYWIDQREGLIIVAAADCTGHGVPGAIVSMLGISALAKIAGKTKTPKPNEILNQLRDEIINMLNPVGSSDTRQDGMDIALVVINTNNKEIEYSGAFNPLILIRDGQLIEKKANRMPIGLHDKNEEKFTAENFSYQSGDIIYMFTDGYADQFGGAAGGKFKTKNFRNLLLNISANPMEEQANMLNNTHLEWRGEHPQIDDILVVGIKLM